MTENTIGESRNRRIIRFWTCITLMPWDGTERRFIIILRPEMMKTISNTRPTVCAPRAWRSMQWQRTERNWCWCVSTGIPWMIICMNCRRDWSSRRRPLRRPPVGKWSRRPAGNWKSTKVENRLSEEDFFWHRGWQTRAAAWSSEPWQRMWDSRWKIPRIFRWSWQTDRKYFVSCGKNGCPCAVDWCWCSF